MISCLLKYFLIFLVASNFTQKSAAVSTPAKSTTTASPETIMSSSTAEPTSLSSTEPSTTSSSAVPSETSPSSSINPMTNTITMTSNASMPSGASTFSSTNETIALTSKTYPNNLARIIIFSCLIFIAACALIAIFVLSHLKKRGRQAFDQEKAMDNKQVMTEDQSFRNKLAFDVSQTQPTQMSRGASLEKTQTSEIGLEETQASE